MLDHRETPEAQHEMVVLPAAPHEMSEMKAEVFFFYGDQRSAACASVGRRIHCFYLTLTALAGESVLRLYGVEVVQLLN